MSDENKELNNDPGAKRTGHFTMKINRFEENLMAQCAAVEDVSKGALIRHLVDEYARTNKLI